MMLRSASTPATLAHCRRQIGQPVFQKPKSRLLASRPASAQSAGAQTQVTTAESNGAPSANDSKENFKGDMLKPSVVNTGGVRAAAMLGTVALLAYSTMYLLSRLGAFLNVTAWAVWLGTTIWNTFFVGINMFKLVPRQTFGKIQAVLFPQYFLLSAACNVIALGSLLVSGTTSPATTKAAASLGLALACTLGNMYYVEPRATKIMFERYAIENKDEKTDEDKARIAALYKTFGKWHGISSLINLIVTCVAIGYGWHVAGSLAL